MSGSRKETTAAALILVLCLGCVHGNVLRRFLRETAEPKTTPKPSFCHRSTPCGWSVYTPFTKEIDYYMANTCICREGLDCIRTENDISIAAFVHRCREKPQTTEKIV